MTQSQVEQILTPDEARIQNIFAYHPPTAPQVAKNHELVRSLAHSMAWQLLRLVPDCPEREVALDKVREAMMWANAGIACNQ